MANGPEDSKLNPVGAWYDYLDELGENSEIVLGRVEPGQDPEWSRFPHQHFDGIGAFIRALREKGQFDGSAPSIQDELKSTSLTWRGLSLMLSFPPRSQVQWRHFERDWKNHSGTSSPNYAKGWRTLSEETSARLQKRAKDEHVTMTSLLLRSLSRVMSDRLTQRGEQSLWMLPVNLRGKVQVKTDTSNQSSLLPITVQPQDTLQQVHLKLDQAKKTGFHWIAWAIANWAPRISAKNARKKVYSDWHRSGHPWMGAFSNLGSWRSNQPDAGNWLFFPTVTKVRPLGAGCLGWEGRLSLCLHAHPALSRNESEVDSWVQSWKRELES